MPTFNYFTGIPAGPDNPSNDQPLMQTNTNSIDGIIGVDHFTFLTNARDGLHQQVNMFAQASPVRQGDVVEYVNTYQGRNVLFAKNATDDFPLYFRAGNGPVGFTSSYGATITQWGFTSAAVSGTPINFPLPFPNQCFVVVVTTANNSTAHRTYNSTNGFNQTQFTPILLSTNGTPETDDICWIAIGF